jgi:transcription antitermination factor NusG
VQAAATEPRAGRDGPPAGWHVLWTRSHAEHDVLEQLAAKKFSLFLPTLDVWLRQNGVRRHACAPMFPGYLFLRHPVDAQGYLEVTKARGLVKVLGDGWDRLAVVSDEELEPIRRVHASRLAAFPHPYLREGHRVRIAAGPLAGTEGILVGYRHKKGLLVISLSILRRSVAVNVDAALVTAA